MSEAYRRSGVDIDAGEAVVDGIREAVRATYRPGVLGDLGGFGALFSLQGRYRDPVLVSGTDGVGTKLLVAARLGLHHSIGIDLVAMCVNDVVVSGAEPLFFLDYFATGKLEPRVAVEVVKGIAEGCRIAGCALVGGETAEMPGMYGPGHYDLAGFCVGAVERDELLDGGRVRLEDAVIGIPSTGLHSNGYSLARRLCDPLDWDAEHGLGRPLGEVLLTPTRIYVADALKLKATLDLHALAHITGGGLVDNIPRVLPAGLGVALKRGSWERPPIFDLLASLGEISEEDLNRTFNMGIGMVAIVPAEAAELAASLVGGLVVGEVRADPDSRVELV